MLAAQENTKEYIWPLTIDNGISSTFQEFRSNHFHAGIDLRTFKTTGFPVRAVSDGVIEKIIVSRTGIGRAIFLRHRDGNLSIYGHLEKFRDDIEALVTREQKRRGEKYFGAYIPAQSIPVSRGTVMAFSGESGDGFPHLHFEIRDKLNGSLNPLSLIGGPSIDNRAPILKGILLRSRGHSLINNDIGEFYFALHDKGSFYAPAETLQVTGPFELVLHTVDLTRAQQVVAPYSLEAYLDGQLYYQILFERLLRDDNNQLGMLYDMSYSLTNSFYYKLFFQSGFNLENRKMSFTDQVSRLTPGMHEIKIIVKDRYNNQAIARIPLQKRPVSEAILLNKKINPKASSYQALLDANVSLYINHDDVVVKVRDFSRPAAWITLKVKQGNQEQVVAASEYVDGVYFCFKPATPDLRLGLRLILSDGRQPVEELQKNIQLLVLESRCARQFHAGDFIADFAAKTVLEPTVLLLENKTLATDYPLLAGPVSISPTNFTFLDTVYFKFRIPRAQARPEQLGICKYHPLSRTWRFIKSQPVPEAGYLGSRVLTGGIFALMRDIFPPEIYFNHSRIQYVDAHEKIVVRLHDRGKGIDYRTVAVFLNGREADSEYDPDWGHIVVYGTEGLRKGKNDMRVHAADFAGNRSEKKFHFQLR